MNSNFIYYENEEGRLFDSYDLDPVKGNLIIFFGEPRRKQKKKFVVRGKEPIEHFKFSILGQEFNLPKKEVRPEECVCTLEEAQILRKAGLKIRSEFQYVKNNRFPSSEYKIMLYDKEMRRDSQLEVLPAPILDEMIVNPEFLDGRLVIIYTKSGEFQSHFLRDKVPVPEASFTSNSLLSLLIKVRLNEKKKFE